MDRETINAYGINAARIILSLAVAISLIAIVTQSEIKFRVGDDLMQAQAAKK